MKDNDESLTDLATKIASQVVARTATINDELQASFNQATNLPVHAGIHNHSWLAIYYFGCYLVLQKMRGTKTPEEGSAFENEFRKMAKFYLIDFVYEEKVKQSEELRSYLENSFDNALKRYAEYRGDVRLLFQSELRDAFNGQEDGKIKFIKPSIKNRFGVKTAFFLAALGGNKEFIDKHKDEFMVPDTILDELGVKISKEFREIE